MPAKIDSIPRYLHGDSGQADLIFLLSKYLRLSFIHLFSQGSFFIRQLILLMHSQIIFQKKINSLFSKYVHSFSPEKKNIL